MGEQAVIGSNGGTDAVQIAIGNISGGTVETTFMQSVVDALVTGAITGGVICSTGPYLDDNRNQVCLSFLHDTDADALLFIDSDIQFTPEHITTLAKAAADLNSNDVVCGWYCSPTAKSGDIVPIAYYWTEIDAETHLHDMVNVPLDDIESASGLVQVSSVGAGFMLIQRPLLETFHKITPKGCPFFTEPVIDGVHFGEDHGFCMRVTDPRIGGRVFVDPRVRVRHHKKVVL